jgi:hypothetical protein
VLATEGARLQHRFPGEFDAIVRGMIEPLAALPGVSALDARSVHAVTWSVVEAKLRGDAITRDEARAHVLAFCGAAIGFDA